MKKITREEFINLENGKCCFVRDEHKGGSRWLVEATTDNKYTASNLSGDYNDTNDRREGIREDLIFYLLTEDEAIRYKGKIMVMMI